MDKTRDIYFCPVAKFSRKRHVLLSDMKTLQNSVESLARENQQLKANKISITDDIIDLKCRSMRDNLLFFGIEEAPIQAQDAGNRSSLSVEDCDAKIHNFCENTLNIPDPQSSIKIDRSHRIGKRAHDKIRPIVVKFQDTKSRQTVKNASKSVDLKSLSYGVSDQYPQEVQDRRKILIPIMIKAREEQKKAVLVRDKLYINNNLYIPPPNTTSTSN